MAFLSCIRYVFISWKAGLRVTYDSVFRRLFRPGLHKDRLEQLLSAIPGQNIRILEIVPWEGTQPAEHGNFVIMVLMTSCFVPELAPMD